MNTYDTTYTRDETMAAVFRDRESAKSALSELHDAGFRDVWLGVTGRDSDVTGEPTVESEGTRGGFMGSLGRFFSGEGDAPQALHETLIRHGLSEADAQRVDATITPGDAVVTVNGENDPLEAREIIERCGGQLAIGGVGAYDVASGTQTYATGLRDAGPGVTTPMSGRANDEAVSMAARDRGTMDQEKRLSLREERLRVDKERVQRGEARIGKDVVSQVQSVDVPVYREELYIERRPASGSSAAASPIGADQEIRIPLSEERVSVSKDTVVTGEVVVGKRRIEDTQTVSDTVRHEELRVDDDTADRVGDGIDSSVRRNI